MLSERKKREKEEKKGRKRREKRRKEEKKGKGNPFLLFLSVTFVCIIHIHAYTIGCA